ncbi:MAG: aspartate-semialdehyde dehydrogenase [Eubacteriales bacterium]|nr:aspartate-semialdehyde dehydrogenase [Eubacteriales bacterium]
MKKFNIAVLGATGAVGREMLKVMEEYDIPVETLLPLASAKSAGTEIEFKGQKIKVQEATDDAFKGMDFVLGAVQNPMSKRFAPAIVKAGATYIDNSSAFRMDPEVPLVVPEINGEDAFTNKGIIANPNCSTIITLMAVAGIAKLSPIKNMIACTYQAVSGAGVNGLKELEDQMKALAEGGEITHKTFPTQIAANVIPMIGDVKDNLYTSEEMKMQNEGRRILHLPELVVNCTCVRVPVMRSHSISVTLRTEKKISIAEANEAIKNYPGVKLIEDIDGRAYPTPLDTSNQDIVYVGRVRDDLTDDHGLTLWCCGDQVRKGAAANAVQIMKKLIEKA